MSVTAYILAGDRLQSMDPRGDLDQAIWIDLYMPGKADYDRLCEIGIVIPRLQDVQQIEPSRRLTRGGDVDGITVLLTEPSGDGDESFAPVTFLLTPERLVTVRYKSKNLWDGFTVTNRRTPGDVALALLSLGVGHIADVLENADRALDRTAHQVFTDSEMDTPRELRRIIRATGRTGEALSDIRLNLLIIRRALTHLDQLRTENRVVFTNKGKLKSVDRDVEALTVHADYLSGRLSLAIDATLGLISLAQNDTARVYSVVATLFLPATLIASIFGMNFEIMPMLDWRIGFAMSLVMMAAASVGIYVMFLIRGWLKGGE